MHLMRYTLFAIFLLWQTGCTAIGPLQTLPENGTKIDSFFVDDAIRNGASSCRYNLEDVIIHSIGNREWSGRSNYPKGDANRRPYTGLYVTKYSNGDQSHLQFVVGKDASGFCTVFTTETRYWHFSCDRVIREHKRYAAGDRTQSENSIVLTKPSSGLRILLTELTTRSCLVTESDIAWRLEPDQNAREWIRKEHGYDPDANP
jgi:hypothetical protein